MNVRRASPTLDCYPALAGERRVALVIGNGAYRHTTRFPNPAKDAHAIAAKLTMLGFEVVGGAENGIDCDRSGRQSLEEGDEIAHLLVGEAERLEDTLAVGMQAVEVDG